MTYISGWLKEVIDHFEKLSQVVPSTNLEWYAVNFSKAALAQLPQRVKTASQTAVETGLVDRKTP